MNTVAFISIIKVNKIMSRVKSGSRYWAFCYRTALQESFYLHSKSVWDKYFIQQAFKSNVCNLTVLNHDSIIDFKSVTYFPEHAKVLSDQCYHNSNNNLPGSSKSNKVKWANIVQLKFME